MASKSGDGSNSGKGIGVCDVNISKKSKEARSFTSSKEGCKGVGGAEGRRKEGRFGGAFKFSEGLSDD